MEVSRIYQTIDAHTAGEPLRIIVSGVPHLPGSTMLEKRQYFRDHFDSIRRALMLEPRGHDDMYGCILTPPVDQDNNLGVLFMHNENYSTMCGHGVIAVVTFAVQNGMVREPSNIRIDAPANLVRAKANFSASGRVESVTFENVPSFVYARQLNVGQSQVDIVFGGAFYALIESPLPIDGAHLGELRTLGMQIKRELAK